MPYIEVDPQMSISYTKTTPQKQYHSSPDPASKKQISQYLEGKRGVPDSFRVAQIDLEVLNHSECRRGIKYRDTG